MTGVSAGQAAKLIVALEGIQAALNRIFGVLIVVGAVSLATYISRVSQ